MRRGCTGRCSTTSLTPTDFSRHQQTETTLPPWHAARLAVLFDALGGVPISDVERRSLVWLAEFEAHTVENVAVVITRVQQTR